MERRGRAGRLDGGGGPGIGWAAGAPVARDRLRHVQVLQPRVPRPHVPRLPARAGGARRGIGAGGYGLEAGDGAAEAGGAVDEGQDPVAAAVAVDQAVPAYLRRHEREGGEGEIRQRKILDSGPVPDSERR